MDLNSEDEFVQQLDSDVYISSEEETTTQSNEKKMYISVIEATKTIGTFDGSNKEPTVFTDACERAYRRIDPRDISILNDIIRSKIQGKAHKNLFNIEMDFHLLLLEIKQKYVPLHQVDWIYELINSRQEIYENPIRFGKRLEKIVEYAIKIYNVLLSPILAQNQIETIRKTALRVFLNKLSNEKLRTDVSEKNPKSLKEAINITENIWNFLNDRFGIRPNENIFCPYCKDREYHYFDCQIEKY